MASAAGWLGRILSSADTRLGHGAGPAATDQKAAGSGSGDGGGDMLAVPNGAGARAGGASPASSPRLRAASLTAVGGPAVSTLSGAGAPDSDAPAKRNDEEKPWHASTDMMSAAAAVVSRVLTGIGRSLTPQPGSSKASGAKGRRGSDWTLDLTEADLYGDGADTDLFINSHSVQKTYEYFKNYGLWDHCASKGFRNLQISFDLSNPYSHRCIVTGEHDKLSDRCKLMEIAMRRVSDVSQLRASASVQAGEGQRLFLDAVQAMSATHLDLSVVEWLVLQNPAEHFRDDRRPLPDQEHPGLGCLAQANQLLVEVASQNHRDALVNSPAHFHNAFLYGVKGGYLYGNPEMEGAFRTLVADVQEDIATRGLGAVTNAILFGRLTCTATGGPVKWTPEDQLYPLSDRIKAYFKSAAYKNLLARSTIAPPEGQPNPGVFRIQWSGELPDGDTMPLTLVQVIISWRATAGQAPSAVTDAEALGEAGR